MSDVASVSEFGYRCVPTDLPWNEVLARLSWTQFGLYVLALTQADARWHLPFNEMALKSLLAPLRSISPRDVALWRDLLLDAGVLVVVQGAKRPAVEIVGEFRHEKGRKFSFAGGDAEPAAVQAEMRFPPTVFRPPPVRTPDLPPRSNARRAENNGKEHSESPAREARAAQEHAIPAGKRARASGEGNEEERRRRGDFAMSREAVDDDLWRALFDYVGAAEMRTSGMKWLMRHGIERDAVNASLSDARTMTVKTTRGALLEWLWGESPAGRREAASRKKRA